MLSTFVLNCCMYLSQNIWIFLWWTLTKIVKIWLRPIFVMNLLVILCFFVQILINLSLLL